MAVPIPNGTAINAAPNVMMMEPVISGRIPKCSSMGYQRVPRSEDNFTSANVGMPSRIRKKKISPTKSMAEYPDALTRRVMINSRQFNDFSIMLHARGYLLLLYRHKPQV